MSKGKRKRDDEGLDFGIDPNDEAEETEGEETKETEVDVEEPPKQDLKSSYDLNRIVVEDEDIRFSGKVNPEDIPQCPCCGAEWSIREGAFVSPGCGCAIHPICSQCGKCEAHCLGHYTRR